ncbi:MAG: hypothetical protein NC429_16275 [Lachnospiraceae bacterium]|nr:hypothetical protein [Lachnospiraceae bacterium]
MRIDSSNIGMESARRFSSVSGRVSRIIIANGRQSLKDGTGALFGNLLGTDEEQQQTQSKEKEYTSEELRDRLDEMQSKLRSIRSGNIRTVNSDDAAKQLRDIRQQCIVFLMDILFPGRRRSSVWDQELSAEDSEQQNIKELSSEDLLFGSGVNIRSYQLVRQYYHEETENTGFTTQGTVRCADGREISFNLNLEMSRSFQEYYEETVSMKKTAVCDPLVINLDGNIAELSDQTFLFDLDGDGELDEINQLSAKSGFLALDKNGDGIINDGTELFGAKSGNGFEDLAAYDTDHNGFIDEGDEIWDKLRIWAMDENGNKQLYSLAEKGVGAICLQNASTDFTLTGEDNQVNALIRKTGIFLYESGAVGTVQHVDMALHGKEDAGFSQTA